MAESILTDAERKALQAILKINDYGTGRAISDSDVYDTTAFGKKPVIEEYWRSYAPNLDYYLANELGAETSIARYLYDDELTPNEVIQKIQADEGLFPKDSSGSQKQWFNVVQNLFQEKTDLEKEFGDATEEYENSWKSAGLPDPEATYEPILYKPYSEFETNVRKFIRSKNNNKYTPYEETVVQVIRTNAQNQMREAGITPFNDAVLKRKASLLGVTLPEGTNNK